VVGSFQHVQGAIGLYTHRRHDPMCIASNG
jgi:hypothetical protein